MKAETMVAIVEALQKDRTVSKDLVAEILHVCRYTSEQLFARKCGGNVCG